MPFEYVQSFNRYRDTDTGRFVSQITVNSIVRRSIEHSSDGIGEIAQLTASGTINASTFNTQAREHIKGEYIRQYLLGRGGRENMTQRDWGIVGSQLKNQYKYLDNLTSQIASGAYADFPDALHNRLNLYIESSQAAFNVAQVEDRGMPRLSQVPADGQTRCMTRCKCLLEFVKTATGWLIWWRLNPAAKHCFPSGTMIETEYGQKPIEQIIIGDMVKTLHGYKRVTRLYEHNHNGDLIQVTVNGQHVSCTPNHPFLTQRGWIRADQIKQSDNLVLLENVNNPLLGHFTFPYPLNEIATRMKVFILRPISLLLGKLPISQRFKAWVSMPILSISLNNQITNTGIYNKFSLHNEERFMFNTQRIKNFKHLDFEFGWRSHLPISLTLNKGSHSDFIFLWMVIPILLNFVNGLLIEHGVAIGHSFGSRVVQKVAHRFFGDFNTNSICSGINGRKRKTEFVSAIFNTIRRVMNMKKVVEFISPHRTLINTISAVISFARTDVPAIWTIAPFLLAFWQVVISSARSPFNLLSSVTRIPTSDTTKTLIRFFDWVLTQFAGMRGINSLNSSPSIIPVSASDTTEPITSFRDWVAAKFARLHHNNRPQLNLITSGIVPVYNLEVQGVHQYFANGVLVHNCDDCIAQSQAWSPLVFENGSFKNVDIALLGHDWLENEAVIKEWIRLADETGDYEFTKSAFFHTHEH